MLGHKIVQHLQRSNAFEVLGVARQNRLRHSNFAVLDLSNGFGNLQAIIDSFSPSVVINCVGAIKQRSYSSNEMFYLNSALPQFINLYSKIKEFRFIHISTDCVFTGDQGDYHEFSDDISFDPYGMSKRLGENIADTNLVIRTSIIGHELSSRLSLLEWFLGAESPVTGYTNVLYSGLTTVELSKHLVNLLMVPKFSGVYNISSQYISKFELLTRINQVYKLDKLIVPSAIPVMDRTLNSQKYSELKLKDVLSWDEQIREMKNDWDLNGDIYNFG
jgi:dTDP-4-dehydrorhamnose reductase